MVVSYLAFGLFCILYFLLFCTIIFYVAFKNESNNIITLFSVMLYKGLYFVIPLACYLSIYTVLVFLNNGAISPYYIQDELITHERSMDKAKLVLDKYHNYILYPDNSIIFVDKIEVKDDQLDYFNNKEDDIIFLENVLQYDKSLLFTFKEKLNILYVSNELYSDIYQDEYSLNDYNK